MRKGRFTSETMQHRLGLIQPQLTYEGFEQADLIIEAVFENLALKKEIFAELDRAAKPECILASNTSTLNIDAIAASTSRAAPSISRLKSNCSVMPVVPKELAEVISVTPAM